MWVCDSTSENHPQIKVQTGPTSVLSAKLKGGPIWVSIDGHVTNRVWHIEYPQ